MSHNTFNRPNEGSELNVLFVENQKFTQSGLFLTLGIFTVLMPLVMFFVLLTNEAFAGLPPYLSFLMLFMAIFCAFLWWYMRLEVKIMPNGIHYRFYGWHFSPRFIGWEELKHCYTRQYSPAWEYGGWGIRWRMGKGRAFNVYGNKGLQLVLTDGSKILIGTQRPEEIEGVLKKLNQWRPEGGVGK